MKNKKFAILTIFWGFLLTLISIPVFLCMLCLSGKPKRYCNCLYFEYGRYWGGIEFGWFFVVNKNPTQHLLDHEYGHGIQNCIFGPAFMLLWIFGIVRYWVRELIKAADLGLELPPYDSAWNEQNATDLGAEYREMYDKMYGTNHNISTNS